MSQHHKDAPHNHSLSTNPQREHPSTYFMQDRSSLDEMERLRIQDQLTTAMMGGVLAEQPHPERFEQVLDVGCGIGGWLIEVAKQYPDVKRLVGIDISAIMLAYAKEQAKDQGVNDRVEFRTMDAIRLLEFPANTFNIFLPL